MGVTVAAAGIEPGSLQAMKFIPMLTLLVAIWLLVFSFLKAGRIVRYISSSVMGGFVTGICCTIILMQVPKLFGGSAGSGEAPELIIHIIYQLELFNPVSFSLSMLSIAIIMLARKFIPRLPMSVIVMAAAANPYLGIKIKFNPRLRIAPEETAIREYILFFLK